MTLRGGGASGGGGELEKVDSLKEDEKQGPRYSPGGAGRKGRNGRVVTQDGGKGLRAL